MLQSLKKETEGKLQMLLSHRKGAGGHPKASPRPSLQPLLAVPALRELESACRMSTFGEMLSQSPRSAFSGFCRDQRGSAAVCDPNPPRPFALYRFRDGETTIRIEFSLLRGGGSGGQRGKSSKTAVFFFPWETPRNKILKVQILLSRNFAGSYRCEKYPSHLCRQGSIFQTRLKFSPGEGAVSPLKRGPESLYII